jgi:hypothetical protein
MFHWVRGRRLSSQNQALFNRFLSGMQQHSDDPRRGFLSLLYNRVILKKFWAKLQVSWLLGESES